MEGRVDSPTCSLCSYLLHLMADRVPSENSFVMREESLEVTLKCLKFTTSAPFVAPTHRQALAFFQERRPPLLPGPLLRGLSFPFLPFGAIVAIAQDSGP